MSVSKTLLTAYISLADKGVSELMDIINGGNNNYYATKTNIGDCDLIPVIDIKMNSTGGHLFRIGYGFVEHTPRGMENGLTYHVLINNVDDTKNLHTEVAGKVAEWIANTAPRLVEVKENQVVVDRDKLGEYVVLADLAKKYLNLTDCKCGVKRVASYPCENTSCETHNER